MLGVEPCNPIPASACPTAFWRPPLAQLGRMEGAKAVAARVLTLQPSFRARRFCAALALPAAPAKPLTEA
jgi:hypothetical protein